MIGEKKFQNGGFCIGPCVEKDNQCRCDRSVHRRAEKILIFLVEFFGANTQVSSFQMQNEIVTQRLTLHLLNFDDHDFIRRLVNTKGWIEFIGDRNVHSADDAIAYVTKITGTPDLFYWVVRLKDGDAPVGIISFMKRAYLESFDIGFAFLPEFNGHGYAYEASREILSIVSQKAAYDPILATTIPRNANSIKLLKKLGLQFEKQIEVDNEILHVYSNAIKIELSPDPETSGDSCGNSECR